MQNVQVLVINTTFGHSISETSLQIRPRSVKYLMQNVNCLSLSSNIPQNTEVEMRSDIGVISLRTR